MSKFRPTLKKYIQERTEDAKATQQTPLRPDAKILLGERVDVKKYKGGEVVLNLLPLKTRYPINYAKYWSAALRVSLHC